MLSGRLVRLIEDHAEELTRELLDDVLSNPHTLAFHALPQEELRRRLRGVHRNLAQWLHERSEPKVVSFYEELGRRRFTEGVPLSQLVFVFNLIKRRLRREVMSSGLPASVIEVYQLEEFEAVLDGFFDKALYHTVIGYEEAMQEEVEEG
jgi:hypothetical protein